MEDGSSSETIFDTRDGWNIDIRHTPELDPYGLDEYRLSKEDFDISIYKIYDPAVRL